MDSEISNQHGLRQDDNDIIDTMYRYIQQINKDHSELRVKIKKMKKRIAPAQKQKKLAQEPKKHVLKQQAQPVEQAPVNNFLSY